MTKQEKIQEAFLEIGLPFTENVIYDNGWLKIKPTQHSSKYDSVDLLKLTNHVHSIRPKQLQGIENNNGWIKLELGSDLPKTKCDLWVLNNGKVFYYSDFEPDNECCQRYVIDNYSHYQLIQKPQPPIF